MEKTWIPNENALIKWSYWTPTLLPPKTFLIKRVEKNPHIFRKHLISPKLNYKHNLHLYTLLTVRKSVQELSEKTWPMTASLALKGCVGQDSTRAFLLSPGFSAMLSCEPPAPGVSSDWSVAGLSGSERLMSMSCSSLRSSWCRLQQWSAAGSSGWASVLNT